MFRLDDGRPSDVHAHAHCLKSEQCACTYDLNKKVIAGWQCIHVWSGPGPDRK